MKQMLRKKDVWVLLAALIGAFACVTLIQFISGRIDGVASMVFLLAVFFVSMYTDGYWWGVAGSVISVLAVNFAFRTPYFAFNFTIPENIFSGVGDAGGLLHDEHPDHPHQSRSSCGWRARQRKCGPTSCGLSPTTCAPR